MTKWCFLVALTGVTALSACKDAKYSDQYITLPSGLKAYCNRQGFREVSHMQLVTDPSGNFVKCDARVGPSFDNKRTNEDGRMLTEEEFTAREVAAYKENAQRVQNHYDELGAKSETEQSARHAKAVEEDRVKARRDAQVAALHDKYDGARQACDDAYEHLVKAYDSLPPAERTTEHAIRLHGPDQNRREECVKRVQSGRESSLEALTNSFKD